MKKITFEKGFRNWVSIRNIVIYLMIPTIVVGGLVKQLEIKTAQASEYQIKYETIASKVDELEVMTQVATTSAKPVYLSEEQIRKILEILMPEKDIKHFMKILKCENGNHDPKRVNINKPGLGYDLGIAQINSRFHANRVEEFFGQDFNEAMSDPVKNLVYATYLYQHSKFEPWVCNRIVKGGD